MTSRPARALLLALALGLSGCSDAAPAVKGAPSAPAPEAEAAQAPDETPLQPASDIGLSGALRAMIDRPFTGDLDGMEARRMIRVGVTFNRTHYFVDRGTQRGLSFAHLQQFETNLNAARRTGHLRIMWMRRCPPSCRGAWTPSPLS
jgi:hypothetical protein